MKPPKGNSFKLHGIRFYWNYDSLSYEAQVDPDDIEDVFNLGVESVTEEIYNDWANPEPMDFSFCPEPAKYAFPPGFESEEEYQEVKRRQREAEKAYNEAPRCPHCGIPHGFAMGTGDCGCEVDPE